MNFAVKNRAQRKSAGGRTDAPELLCVVCVVKERENVMLLIGIGYSCYDTGELRQIHDNAMNFL